MGEVGMPGWVSQTAMNNLRDVYTLYCENESRSMPLKKFKRDVFVQGTMQEVRDDLEELMTYCANDVAATHRSGHKLIISFCLPCIKKISNSLLSISDPEGLFEPT